MGLKQGNTEAAPHIDRGIKWQDRVRNIDIDILAIAFPSMEQILESRCLRWEAMHPECMITDYRKPSSSRNSRARSSEENTSDVAVKDTLKSNITLRNIDNSKWT